MRLDDLISAMIDEADSWTNVGMALELCARHPEAVEEYLHEHRITLVAEVVAARGRSRRSWTAAKRPVSVFSEAVESGTEAVEQWRRTFASAAFAVNDENVQKKVARMTRADLVYVSDAFARRSRENALMGEVFRLLAERVPPGMEVRDVYTEQELEDLRSRVLTASV